MDEVRYVDQFEHYASDVLEEAKRFAKGVLSRTEVRAQVGGGQSFFRVNLGEDRRVSWPLLILAGVVLAFAGAALFKAVR